jgi:hypothetical protein
MEDNYMINKKERFGATTLFEKVLPSETEPAWIGYLAVVVRERVLVYVWC